MTRKARKAQPKGARSGRKAGTSAPKLKLPRPEKGTPFAEALDKLTAQRQQFVLHYITHHNGTHAALHAGYTETNARFHASYLLTIPNIKTAIRLGYDQLSAPAEEVLARTVEVMRADIGDFFSFDTEQVRRHQLRPVRDLVAELQAEIDFEDRFAQRTKLGKDEQRAHRAGQLARQRSLLRLQMELEANPDAQRWAPGAPEYVQVERLDLAKAKALGKLHLVKSVKPTRWGTAIELQDPQHARDLLGKAHGLWRPDDEGGDNTSGLEELVKHMAERKRQRDEERGRT